MLLLAEFDECMVECDGRLCDAEREVGVQNPDQGGANAPPSLFVEALSRAASEAYLFNDRQGVQGGSSLIEYRGCIVKLYHFDW